MRGRLPRRLPRILPAPPAAWSDAALLLGSIQVPVHPGHIRFAEAGLWKRGGARDAAAVGWLVGKAEEGRCGAREVLGWSGVGEAGDRLIRSLEL